MENVGKRREEGRRGEKGEVVGTKRSGGMPERWEKGNTAVEKREEGECSGEERSGGK
jgi:hypothetical protein